MITRRLERDTVVYEDGQLAIKHEYSVFSEPKIVTMFWGFGPCAKQTAEPYIGKSVKDVGNGRYDIHVCEVVYGGWETLRLPEDGSTKAFKVIESDYPCPPVRKGIETRYYSGVWQKYTKRDGWVQL